MFCLWSISGRRVFCLWSRIFITHPNYGSRLFVNPKSKIIQSNYNECKECNRYVHFHK